MAVPPTAQGTRPSGPNWAKWALTALANAIPGPTPQVLLVSMSAWRGSRAVSQWSLALRRRM
uniref:Uncharacterized protein n=1 Tax=Cannabis sativa TaxID=3483 RepID=A0A803R098_CANSA